MSCVARSAGLTPGPGRCGHPLVAGSNCSNPSAAAAAVRRHRLAVLRAAMCYLQAADVEIPRGWLVDARFGLGPRASLGRRIRDSDPRNGRAGEPRMIYDPEAHEPLTETPWGDGRVREAIAAIVADAERSIEDGFWPNHPQADDEEPPLLDGLADIYLGAAGMVWALYTLGSSLDLASLAEGAVRRYRERPDWGENVPSLLAGESGILLVAGLVGASPDYRERLRERIVENERNPTWELMWGSPGTMLAARVARLDAEYERSAAVLLA